MLHPKALLLTLIAAAPLTAAEPLAATAPIKTPSEFLGFTVGADRTLADYRQISGYFRMLDSASDRLQLQNLGKSTLGEEMIMAVISSEENIRNLARIRTISKQLADPRGLADAQIEALAREGKVVLLVTCNIHATEIGASQMAMEWAHALVTAQDAESRRRLDNVVLLLVPSLNPDGQMMEVEWYRKHVGTKFEGGRLPWLYHHYVGHDNNRDWFMLTQKESKAMNRAIYHEWFPQVFLDEHQMGSTTPRIFVPPFAEPVDPDIHPLIWREVNLIGATMALRLEQAEKSGVIYGYAYDAYWIGGTKNTAWWKNISGLLTEVASVRIASPVFIDPIELGGGRKGLIEHTPQTNFPNPWKGGWWRLRDIMDYERIASDALLEISADRRLDFLKNQAARARAVIAAATPREAYRIPAAQHDRAAADRLVALMAEHNVEVKLAGNGDAYIPLAQPYGKFVREMFEPQRYPEVKAVAGKEIIRPYDVAAWTLPLMMGVAVEKSTLPATGLVVAATETAPPVKKPAAARPPRVATYKPWLASMDEGWTRWVLEQNGYQPKTLDNKTIRAGQLSQSHDAIILADISKEIITSGKWKVEDDSMKYFPEFPPEYRGGLEKEGAKALREFVEAGGTLIAFGAATEYVIEEFNIPVRNALAKVKSDDFAVPGSILRVKVNPDHPVTRGLPAESVVFLDSSIAFQTAPPGAELERTVLATYPDDPRDILLSGWIRGPEKLAKKAAAVALTYGKGKIVLLGFRPQHRAQTLATFPYLFNAINDSVTARPLPAEKKP